MKLTTETIKSVTGVEYKDGDKETVDEVFIPATQTEASRFCNQSFIPELLPEGKKPEPDYPFDLGVAVCKRVVELFNTRNQVSSKEIKSQSVGSMRVDYFENDNNGKSDEFHAVLDRYRIPSL